MKTLKYVFIYVFIVCIFSCKQYGHGYIKGTVYETGTGLPIAGAHVKIQSFCHNCGYKYDSTLTDSHGKFVFYFRREINTKYYLHIWANEHFPLKQEIGDKTNDLTLTMEHFAYFKVRLNKTSNSSNACQVYSAGNNTNNYTGIWNGVYHHDNSPVDTLISKKITVHGNTTFTLSWSVIYYPVPIFGDKFKRYNEPITVNYGDTLTYAIKYD